MSIKTISYNQGNNIGVLSPLISFDCIFDTDFGLLKLIRREYFDTTVFSSDFFVNNETTRQLTSTIYMRESKNPLSLCVKNKDINIDELYEEFMEREYSKILNYAMPTEIYNLLEYFKLSGDIKPTILYKDNRELELLKKFELTKNIKTIHIDDINNLENIPYQQFFFKELFDETLYTLCSRLSKKTIYLMSYLFNIKDNKDIILNKNSGILSLNKNVIYLMDMYNKSKLKGE